MKPGRWQARRAEGSRAEPSRAAAVCAASTARSAGWTAPQAADARTHTGEARNGQQLVFARGLTVNLCSLR